MERKSHAIIILGILYNNSIVDRKFSGKKGKGSTKEREGKHLRKGKKYSGQGKQERKRGKGKERGRLTR